MDDVDALIRQAAAALAPAYRSLDLANAAGLLLDTYYDGEVGLLTPMAVEIRPGEVTPDVRLNGDQEELGYPDIDQDSALWAQLENLNRRINDTATGGYRLSNAYFLALAEAMHRELGIPVLAVDNELPIAVQLQRQLGRS
jgi:hypothetical protein